MATAKQRAWRAKFARLYGGGKKRSSSSPRKRARRSVNGMAKKRRSGGGRGFMSGQGMLGTDVKNGLAGWGAASVAEMFGFAGVIPSAIAGFVAAGKMGAVGAVVKPLVKGVDVKGVGGQIAGNAIG
jgi:hypothetical protein